MHKFSVSTNIERDKDIDIQYIPTPNARGVFERIANNFRTGHRAFNVIGSYGTGKSSFLWALERSLGGDKTYFGAVNGQFNGVKDFSFFKLIGENSSLKAAVGKRFGLENPSSKDIFLHLDKKSHEDNCLVIVIDEFGKFLEYAVSHEPAAELYFVQELAEYANDPKRNIILITALHQNFGTYARKLAKEERNEWEKVKGRLTDISFNEPIEQLLFLASEQIQSLDFKVRDEGQFKELFGLLKQSHLLNNTGVLSSELATKLFPLDYLSATVLAKSLMEYGQNERSLFTFLGSNEKVALKNFVQLNGNVFHVGKVYDYLYRNLSTELTDRYSNKHKAQWEAAFLAFDRISMFASDSNELENMVELIKTILLVNLFGRELGKFDQDVLSRYAGLAMGISDAGLLIDKLKRQRIIVFKRSKNKLEFVHGTSLDIEEALDNADGKIEKQIDITGRLRAYIDLPLVPAKAYQYKYGTPRFFKFRFVDDLIFLTPQGEIDGYINILFDEKNTIPQLLKVSKAIDSLQVFVVVKAIHKVKQLLFEIDKIKFVIEGEAKDDTEGKLLLSEEKDHLENEIKKLIESYLFQSSEDTYWIYQGEEIQIPSKTVFNKKLSEYCEEYYSKTPVFRNELANREQLSTPILTARKALLSDLLENGHLEDLGYSKDRFPPQKTIYLSLLKKTGIHKREESGYFLSEPEDPTFSTLWERSQKFLDEAVFAKKPLKELYESLKRGDLKLKKGFVDFWVPIFLIIKKEDFALFHKDRGYVPYIDNDVLDLMHKKPSDYSIRSYKIEGIKINLYQQYREITAMPEAGGQGSSFIRIFSAFVKFYRNLPAYTLQTGQLTAEAKAFREAIAKAEDPATALFETIPSALGYGKISFEENNTLLKGFIVQINEVIYELRTAYDNLLNRIEARILEVTGTKQNDFVLYKPIIQAKFKRVKSHLLIPKYQAFYTRLMSMLDDRDSWLKSLADQLLGKSIDRMMDREEVILMDRLQDVFSNLERLVEVHDLMAEGGQDEVFSIDLLDSQGNKQHDKVIIREAQKESVEELSTKLKSILGDDHLVNKATLFKLLQDFLKP